ncbi:Endoplasmic Reticulum Oxidoreductin 1 (ERO1) [Cichlidogyrus casuarinus]|uniref:Endoplasmic Reticulum Oxidoreductin 1 (ERO1) n=1 Tax=Cichlidogyrus casuarinus TaxID=1844966 RepID=A0ABD2QIG6_9PLAT
MENVHFGTVGSKDARVKIYLMNLEMKYYFILLFNKSIEECKDSHLGDLNPAITKSDKHTIEQWTKHDDRIENTFCEIDDEKDSQAGYVDLTINPEQYTGYKGPSANKIWYTIYEENCFKPPHQYQHSPFLPLSLKWVLFAIGIYFPTLESSNPLQKTAKFGPNVEEFKRRFHPLNEASSKFRIRNLYFTYVVELKAIVKAAPFLRKQRFFTNNEKLDAETRRAVNSLLDLIETKGNFFDESALFRGTPAEAGALKTEFRNHFRNISRIMDCVGCEKCRLWGKLQTQGMGTSLRILFTGHEQQTEDDNITLPADFQLKRSEIVSLFNAFGRLATSIAAIDHFCELDSSCDADGDICMNPNIRTEL